MKQHAITIAVVAVVAGLATMIAVGARQVDTQYRAYDEQCRAIGGITLVANQRYHCVRELTR